MFFTNNQQFFKIKQTFTKETKTFGNKAKDLHVPILFRLISRKCSVLAKRKPYI